MIKQNLIEKGNALTKTAVDFSFDSPQTETSLNEVNSNSTALSLRLEQAYKESLFYRKKDFKNRILIKLGNKYIPLKINDIAYFYKDDIVFARTFKGDNYPLSDSLTTIEKQVSLDLFFRANRQILVNIEAIEYLALYKPGQLLLKVLPRFEENILLSQERSSTLKALLS